VKVRMENKLLINALSIRSGGSATFLRNLLPILSKILPDWKISLVISEISNFSQDFRLRNIECIFIPEGFINSTIKRLYFEHLYMPEVIKKHRTQVFWQVDEMLSPLVSSTGVKTVATFHTTPLVMLEKSTGDSRLFNKYALYLRRHAAKCATIPISVSHHAKAELCGLFHTSGERIKVIYHGVNDSHFSPGKPDETLLKLYGLNRPYILSVSHRYKWKNYYQLVRAHDKFLRTGNEKIDLVLVGEQKSIDEEKKITEYIEANGLNNYVHLVDHVEESQLPTFYRGAHAYIFPSTRETFGLTLLEAMASGVPVGCSHYGPFLEVGGESVNYFDPYNIDDIEQSLIKLCYDQNFRSSLIEKGLNRSKNFTWKKCAEKYSEIFVNLI
jgi:glycosyltransferase involved in cell wall biosynthesis